MVGGFIDDADFIFYLGNNLVSYRDALSHASDTSLGCRGGIWVFKDLYFIS
jgi:hypothetical protein